MKGNAAQSTLGAWAIRIAATALPLLLGFAGASADEGDLREGSFVAHDAPPLAAMQTASAEPGFYQTSEYMIGRVAVGLILPESDGTIDAELSAWTPEQRQRVLTEVRAGLDWWSHLSPEAGLTFILDDHASVPVDTAYEPITHPQYQESLWIGDTLSRLGYSSGSHWTRVRQYVNDLRDTYDTDWAFAVFVVNSDGDADAAFADRYFAYAYIGGPYLVMTYNNAGYGIGNMDAVTAHETGHIFRALDQYASADVACTARSGYLGIETQNSQRAGCASNVASIMRGGIYPYSVRAIDPYARGQIGWQDTDGDRIYDPVDTDPWLEIESATGEGGLRHFSGRASDTPYPSPLRPPAAINAVLVEYSVNGAAWQPADPLDGAFDSADEAFALSLSLAASGNHRIALRARNSAGNVSATTAYVAVVPDPIDGGLDTWLEAPIAGRSDSAGVTAWRGVASSFRDDGTPGPAVVGVEYRIDGGAWLPAEPEDGTFESTEEAFIIPLHVPGGTYRIEARAIDANGKIEQNSASLEIRVNYAVFIPMMNK